MRDIVNMLHGMYLTCPLNRLIFLHYLIRQAKNKFCIPIMDHNQKNKQNLSSALPFTCRYLKLNTIWVHSLDALPKGGGCLATIKTMCSKGAGFERNLSQQACFSHPGRPLWPKILAVTLSGPRVKSGCSLLILTETTCNPREIGTYFSAAWGSWIPTLSCEILTCPFPVLAAMFVVGRDWKSYFI